ncbi:hypothetical protein GCM10010174_30470 [Kutzneria viridogrisea]
MEFLPGGPGATALRWGPKGAEPAWFSPGAWCAALPAGGGPGGEALLAWGLGREPGSVASEGRLRSPWWGPKGAEPAWFSPGAWCAALPAGGGPGGEALLAWGLGREPQKRDERGASALSADTPRPLASGGYGI